MQVVESGMQQTLWRQDKQVYFRKNKSFACQLLALCNTTGRKRTGTGGAPRRVLMQSHGQGVYKVLESLYSLSSARVKPCTNSFEVLFVTAYTLNHK